MPITQYLHHQRFSPAAIRLRAMTNETETLTSGIDPASFSSVIKPTNDLFRYVNGPWIDTYRLPDDRSRYGSFDKLAEDAENQVRDILDADDCPAVKSEALYRSFLNTDAIEAAGLDPIRDELDLIDSAIDKAALTRVLGTINPAGGPDLFGLAVYGDPGDPDRNIAAALAAGSWRDMTRVALTDPDRTRAMVEEDADNVERLLRMMAARLTEVADELHGADAGAIAAFFADGQPFRDYKSAVRSGADGDGPVFDLTIPAEGWQAALLDSARRGEHILRFGDDYTACVQRRSAM